MDEDDMRAMLGRLADAEGPPPRIDVRQAIVRGRRGRRLRTMTTGGSTLAVGAVVGVVVALAVPGAARTGSAPESGVSASASPATAAPARFNPLVPYASFGWLPAGFSPHGGAAPGAIMTAQAEGLSAGTGSEQVSRFNLTVTVARSCTESGSAALPVLRCPTAYRYDYAPPIRATSSAPDVNGRSAFWVTETGSSTLLWQYAPGAWSFLEVVTVDWPLTPARTQMVIRVAANVRYGNTAPLTFPYWTTGVPAGWKATLASFLVSPSGQLLGQDVILGRAANPDPIEASPDTLQLTVVHAISPDPCKSPPGGHVTNVTLDGTKAILTTGNGQGLCVGDVGGLWVSVSLSSNPVGDTPGALGFARSLHLLGPDESNWTSNPMR
jgi:hypothetical protein